MTSPDASAAGSRRHWWLGAVGLRLALGIVALPLTPLLFRDQLLVLLAMRPTREFLLLGGFRVRTGELELLAILLVTLPIFLLGNWLFFGLGRAYRDEIAAGTLPPWLARTVDPDQVARLRYALGRRGVLLVVLARLAIFPATLLAAAAGASDLSTRRYLLADTTSAALAYVEYVGAGYVLGRAYESAGPWITAVGVALLALILWVMGRTMREADEEAAGALADAAAHADGADDLRWPGDEQPDTASA